MIRAKRCLALRRRRALTNKEVYECSYAEQYTKDNSRVKQSLLKATAGVKARREVISAERAAQRGAGSLQEDSYDEERRKGDLHVRKDAMEKIHRGEDTMETGLPQGWLGAVFVLTLGMGSI